MSPSSTPKRAVVWFTRDLRVHDHPALDAALRSANEIVPVFVFEPRLLARSANRARFLHGSLADLDASLRDLGGLLVTRTSQDPVGAVVELAKQIGASAIHLTADHSAYARNRERRLFDTAGTVGVRLHPGNAVVEPGTVVPASRAGGNGSYMVFTPFHRAWAQVPRRSVLAAPRRIAVPEQLRDGRIDPGPRPDPEAIAPDSPEGPKKFPGGERAARAGMDAFAAGDAERARNYDDRRNELADETGTSRLSPYLRFGCISPNELAHRFDAASPAFVRQLAWRDFYLQLLAVHPDLAWRDLRPYSESDRVPGDVLDAWAEGRTGVPLVDAAMRQLRREGWMHNRARMVVASFLTRRLGVPWQEGLAVFDRYLLDGDVANDAGSWQWTAGTGTDPRRQRTFNPVRQSERFDPDGAYITRYLPELAAAGLTPPALFAPWKEPLLAAAAGYPSRPLVELKV